MFNKIKIISLSVSFLFIILLGRLFIGVENIDIYSFFKVVWCNYFWIINIILLLFFYLIFEKFFSFLFDLKMQRGDHLISNGFDDKPICEEEDDILSRTHLVNQMEDLIIHSPHSVININGKWRDGKTSVSCLLEQRLIKDDNNLIIKFNPWSYSKNKSLIRAFFEELSIKLNYKVINQISFILEKQHYIFSFINSFFNKSLNELKSEFKSILINNNQKVFVFIDDIDRLHKKEEVFEVFKLIGQFKNYDNFYFILSFSTQEVDKIICDNKNNTGGSFYDKIIDKQFYIFNNRRDVEEYVLTNINKHFKREILVKNKGYGLKKEFEFSNLRQGKKFINSFISNYNIHWEEMNLEDLRLLTILETFYPDAYLNVLEKSQNILGGGYIYVSNERYQETIDRVIKENISSISKEYNPKDKDIINGILESLFNRRYNDVSKLRSDRKVAYEKNFGNFAKYKKPLGFESNKYIDEKFKNFEELEEEEQVELLSEDEFLWKVDDFLTSNWENLRWNDANKVESGADNKLKIILDLIFDYNFDVKNEIIHIQYDILRSSYLYFTGRDVGYDFIVKAKTSKNKLLISKFLWLNAEAKNDSIKLQVSNDKKKNKVFEDFYHEMYFNYLDSLKEKKEFEKKKDNLLDIYRTLFNLYKTQERLKEREKIVLLYKDDFKKLFKKMIKENPKSGWEGELDRLENEYKN